MSKTENYTTKQHYIPQFLLKNFTMEKAKKKKGHLYEYNKQTGKINKKHTNQVAFAPHLYSIETAKQKDDKLEKIFLHIETKAAPIIKKVIQKHSIEELTGKAINLLAKLIIPIEIRTAHFVNSFNDTAIAELEK